MSTREMHKRLAEQTAFNVFPFHNFSDVWEVCRVSTCIVYWFSLSVSTSGALNNTRPEHWIALLIHNYQPLQTASLHSSLNRHMLYTVTHTYGPMIHASVRVCVCVRTHNLHMPWRLRSRARHHCHCNWLHCLCTSCVVNPWQTQ